MHHFLKVKIKEIKSPKKSMQDVRKYQMKEITKEAKKSVW